MTPDTRNFSWNIWVRRAERLVCLFSRKTRPWSLAEGAARSHLHMVSPHWDKAKFNIKNQEPSCLYDVLLAMISFCVWHDAKRHPFQIEVRHSWCKNTVITLEWLLLVPLRLLKSIPVLGGVPGVCWPEFRELCCELTTWTVSNENPWDRSKLSKWTEDN